MAVKRRGRPPGSKNKPKDPEPASMVQDMPEAKPAMAEVSVTKPQVQEALIEVVCRTLRISLADVREFEDRGREVFVKTAKRLYLVPRP